VSKYSIKKTTKPSEKTEKRGLLTKLPKLLMDKMLFLLNKSYK